MKSPGRKPARKKPVTSFDVARRARVSRATVSFVLNAVEGEKISARTRERVLKAARDLGYVPHAAGKALARRRTENVALVYTRTYHHLASHSIMLRLIDGLMQAVHDHGLHLMIDAVEEVTTGTNLLKLARANHIDGLIMLEPRMHDEQLLALAADRFPVVLVGSLPGTEVCSIDIDNTEAARQAVEHLVSLGHRDIGCITNAPAHFTAAAARLGGYQRALESHGIPLRPSLVRNGAFNPESGYSAMRSLLSEAERPTAVFVASDAVAFGALRAVSEAGLAVPGDLAVFGFDNVVDSLYSRPALSTVGFPVERHGRRSGEILFELMNGTISAPYQEITPFELIVRESSGGPWRPAASGRHLASSSNWKDTQSKEVVP
ncbi:MAG TPA: LacI family DNA-binding transcriptional regulator [Spirochaetia bacterium]|nr:LacI family DNA-binding transcriptional regulator [Spirochaetia bacterium]